MSRFFGKALHSGFVVPDVDQVIERMLASGVGPIFAMRDMRVPARYRGERNDVLITAAFVNSGSMQYEFVEQHDDTPSAYREFIGRNPQGGLHHLAYFCKNYDEAFKHAADHGTEFRIVQEFITPEGFPYEMYVEPLNSPDPLLMQLMIPSPLAAFFEEMEKIAASWNGEDPIRNALDLLSPKSRPSIEPNHRKEA